MGEISASEVSVAAKRLAARLQESAANGRDHIMTPDDARDLAIALRRIASDADAYGDLVRE
jgi:hypothetical protein